MYFSNLLNLPTYFANIICSKHQNITFSVEHEDIALHSLLDAKICRNHGKFVTSVYIKPALFSGIFNTYVSFILTYQKRGLFYTLRHRKFSICCDLKTFHLEIHLESFQFSFEDYPQEKQLSSKIYWFA